MAIVNYAFEQNIAEGWAKVEWEFTSSGEVSPFPNQDEGQTFDCSGLRIAAARITGDIGGQNDNGKVDVMASHKFFPEDFFTLYDFVNANAANKMQTESQDIKYVKPMYNRNNRAVTLTMFFIPA